MHAHIHVHTHRHDTHTHTHTHTHMYTHTCTHTHVHTHMYTQTHTHAYTHMCTHTGTHTQAHKNIYSIHSRCTNSILVSPQFIRKHVHPSFVHLKWIKWTCFLVNCGLTKILHDSYKYTAILHALKSLYLRYVCCIHLSPLCYPPHLNSLLWKNNNQNYTGHLPFLEEGYLPQFQWKNNACLAVGLHPLSVNEVKAVKWTLVTILTRNLFSLGASCVTRDTKKCKGAVKMCVTVLKMCIAFKHKCGRNVCELCIFAECALFHLQSWNH